MPASETTCGDYSCDHTCDREDDGTPNAGAYGHAFQDRGDTRAPCPPADRAVIGVGNGEREPAFTLRLARLPMRAGTFALIKVRVVVGIDFVFHFRGNAGQALSLYPLPLFFALVLVEHRQILVVPPAIRLAHNRARLDRNIFFRHDFVLTRIRADKLRERWQYNGLVRLPV